MSFTNATVIAIIYFLVKYSEIKLIRKENKPMKFLIRDTVIVFVAGITGMYIINYFNIETLKETAGAFTGSPDF
tara:strand:- start:829 stop:1050 length:222 start_codon:yes stop_codon:yes gene_type:complete